MDVIMAIGNADIEAMISESKAIKRAETVEDIDLIEEILTYESYQYIIVNSLLSVTKVTRLAGFIKENLDQDKKPKIIVLLENLSDKKLIAHLVGLDVTAFVPINELHLIDRYMTDYPASYDLSSLGSSDSKDTPISNYKAVNGTIVIGVFGIAHGAGATTAALKISEEIANCGYRVVCAQIDQECFQYYKKRHRNIEYVSVLDKEKDAILQLAYGRTDYQFIVIDFGVMFEIEIKYTDAIPYRKEELFVTARQSLVGEFLRCNYKVGCCFAAPWHTDKLKVFKDHEFFAEEVQQNQLYLLISGDQAKEAIEDYHELEIWDRDEIKDFTDKLKQRIGIGPNINKLRPKWFGRRKG